MGLSPFHTLAPELFASPPSTHPAAKDGFMQTMPPRASLTSSFSVTDANNEVVCPLKNNDGSNCRKRCLGEKRYRSMQEHIRRAHPNNYIPKLPATEESFILMVTTPPEQRAQISPPNQTQSRRRNADRDIYVADASSPATPRGIDEAHPAAATAAVALAQLHHNRLASDWDTDMETHSDNDIGRERMRSSIELPSLRDHFKQESLPPFSPRPRELLPSILNHSPPGRSSTLPPIQRRDKLPRPRKSSISAARKPKHERVKSKEYGRRPSLGDRKALSAEPQTAAWAQGKRWEDLIEAATSATEADDDRQSEVSSLSDTEERRVHPLSLREQLLTVPSQVGRSPTLAPLISNITSAPSVPGNRSSLPPAFQSAGGLPPPNSHRPFPPHSFGASPLHKSLTPPPYETARSRDSDLEPFPSIESSLDSASTASGKNFAFSGHLGPLAKPDSSPGLNLFPRQHHRFSNPTPASFRQKEVQVYCASCHRPWALSDCYACTECICGVCRECVGMYISSPTASFRNVTSSPGSAMSHGPTSYPPRGCPRCRSMGSKWKAFQLEFK